MTIKDWYTKQRTGFVFGLSSWILNNPDALKILIVFSYVAGAFFYAAIGSLLFFYGFRGWGLLLYCLTAYVSYKGVRYYLFKRKMNKQGMDFNFSMSQMLYKQENKEDTENANVRTDGESTATSVSKRD